MFRYTLFQCGTSLLALFAFLIASSHAIQTLLCRPLPAITTASTAGDFIATERDTFVVGGWLFAWRGAGYCHSNQQGGQQYDSRLYYPHFFLLNTQGGTGLGFLQSPCGHDFLHRWLHASGWSQAKELSPEAEALFPGRRLPAREKTTSSVSSVPLW
jgi:hypothetical protein